MTAIRRTAIVAGALYLVTHVTSIAAVVLYDPVLHNAGYVLGSGGVGRVQFGAFLEGILALAVVGTSVTLFPVVKRQNEAVALGYVALRVLEAAIIIAGIVSLLAVVTLRREASGQQAAPFVTAAKALVAFHDWTFLLGPSFVLGVSTTLLAYLMYRSGLVARFIGVLGLIGGPLVFASAVATLFGLYDQVSAWGALAAAPVFAWELSLAFWLIIKGFRVPVQPIQQ